MTWGYRPSLDGLRALAMYLIVLFHVELPGVDGSFIAVNLFFVLSGYLVTNVVMNELDATGRIDLGRFFARRVRRLLPAAVVAIVGTSLLLLLIEPITQRMQILGDARAALLYFANWHFIFQADDYFAPAVSQSPFLHFWTLSIEEQFYLCFPLLVLAVCRVLGRRALIAALAVIFLGSLAAQYYWAGVDANHAYYGTDARVYQLAIGCLLALVLRRWPTPVARRGSVFLAASGMVAFLVLCTSWLELSRASRGVLGTVACAMIIAGLMITEDQALGRVLSWKVPVWLGTLSYATYLWHWPIIIALEKALSAQSWTIAALSAVLATAMAALSAEVLELPVRRAAVLNRFNWRVVGTGVSVSALVAVTAIPVILTSQRDPVLHTNEGTTLSAAAGKKAEGLPKDVDWKSIAADEGTMHTCGAKDPSECIVVRGRGPTMVVIGDSNAMMLSKMFATIARKHGWTLAMNDVPRCVWQEGITTGRGTKKRQQQCREARVGWYDHVLPELRPDLVVLVAYGHDPGNDWVQRDGADLPPRKAFLKASRDTVEKIRDTGARVLLVHNIVIPKTFDPAACLASGKDTGRCAVPISRPHNAADGYYETLATELNHVQSVDLNTAFCPGAPVCQAVVDHEVVWRDNVHLTATYAATRHRQAWRLIKHTGILHGLAER